MRIENYPGAAATLNFQLSSRCKITHLVIVRRIILPQPASTFVKIPIRVVNPTLQAFSSPLSPCPRTNEPTTPSFQLSTFNHVIKTLLYRSLCTLCHILSPSFSPPERETKGKQKGNRSNK